jgi:hypothetical protein
VPDRIAPLIARALDGMAALGQVADAVEDEWQYIADLNTVWGARLQAVADARGAAPGPPGAAEAIDALLAEVALIDDPHRAIDWLSTLPQVALAALGEPA